MIGVGLFKYSPLESTLSGHQTKKKKRGMSIHNVLTTDCNTVIAFFLLITGNILTHLVSFIE